MDFCQLRLMPTLLRETTLLFYYLTFKEDKTTDKPTFALHGHASAPYDQTIYPYRKLNKGRGQGYDPSTPNTLSVEEYHLDSDVVFPPPY